MKQLETAKPGIEVFKPAAFEPGNVVDAMLSEIRRSGYRIVFVLSYDDDAHTLASLGRRESMTTGWAWLVSEERTPVSALAGWLWFRPFLSDVQSFAKQVSGYSMSHFNISVCPDSVDLAYSVALFDAIMLYAHAATKVMLEGGDLRDGEAVTAAVRNTTIEGAGGTPVALDSNGDRIQSYEVMNFVLGAGDAVKSVAVGIFDSMQGQYKEYERAVVWVGNTTDIPVDWVPESNKTKADFRVDVEKVATISAIDRDVLCRACSPVLGARVRKLLRFYVPEHGRACAPRKSMRARRGQRGRRARRHVPQMPTAKQRGTAERAVAAKGAEGAEVVARERALSA